MIAKDNMRAALFLGLVASFLASCSTHSGDYAAQIQKLESANVTAEVKAAVAKGDFRFVAVYGFTFLYPGLQEQEIEKYVPTYGRRVIENTSDVIESKERERLQDAAMKYAAKYNSLLIRKVPPL